jgi:sporulation protein YlmC with PRC-barrel domain
MTDVKQASARPSHWSAMADEDDIAIAFDVLQRGTPVVDRDGVEVGKVREVLDNAREHIFDGIVISTDEGRRFVDAPEVARMTARRVTLAIDRDAVLALPAPPSRLGRLGRLLGR